MRKKIGIIGVGLMGHGIASNVLKGGWSLALLDHPGNQPTDDLVAAGAKRYTSKAQLAEHSDVLIICVTGTPEVEAVLLQRGGALEGLRNGSTVIDCSTAIPGSTLEIAAQVQAKGAHFLDAPMTRTPKEAAEGRLNLIVGGERAVFDAHLPLLQSFAENITFAGPVGSGHQLKLLHNFVSLGFSALLAEAAACAERAGVDPKVLVEVLGKGGGAGVILDRLTPYLLQRDSSSFRFSINNAAKDTEYYRAMCAGLDAEAALAEVISGLYRGFQQQGKGEQFVPQLIEMMNRSMTEKD